MTTQNRIQGNVEVKAETTQTPGIYMSFLRSSNGETRQSDPAFLQVAQQKNRSAKESHLEALSRGQRGDESGFTAGGDPAEEQEEEDNRRHRL